MLRAFYLLLMLFSLAIVGTAQTKSSTQNNPVIPVSSEEDIIKVNTSLINLPIIASDKGGRYVPDLKAADFAIYENGVKQEIDLFSNVTTPFSVVLLIDASGSVDDDFLGIRTAARDFVSNIRDEDRVMVVSFADGIVTHTDFTSDKTKLNKAVTSMIAGGATRLNDALYTVARDVLKKVEGRKAVILISDGIDTASGRTIEDACQQLDESGALVYVVSYPSDRITNNWSNVRIYGTNKTLKDRHLKERIDNTPKFPASTMGTPYNGHPTKGGDHTPPGGTIVKPNRNNMPSMPAGSGKGGKHLTSQTEAENGQTSPFINVNYQLNSFVSVLDYVVSRTDAIQFRAESTISLSGPMKTIAEQLRHIYSLGYYPSNPIEKGGYRKVQVKLARDKKIKLRYKRGYNANAVKTLKAATY